MSASPLTRYPGLFFEPVQLHLQLSDLLVQGILQRLIRIIAASPLVRENLWQLRKGLPLPVCDHVRMHFVMGGYFLYGFLPLDCFYGYSRFEICRELSSLLALHCRSYPAAMILHLKYLSEFWGALNYGKRSGQSTLQ